jgi:hypothetical protein
VPTAEVPLTNLVRESIVDEAELPMRVTAYTPCFRAEAGAAGKDTRGMLRQHQFNKVELVSITTPEQSKDEHERMLSCAEEVLRRLGLHYRVVTLCTGDMGFASQKTYDIEVWLPGQGGLPRDLLLLELRRLPGAPHGCALPRRRTRSPRFVHTLNGSGVAVGRALIAVMETYQQEGGSIAVPDVLQRTWAGRRDREANERMANSECVRAAFATSLLTIRYSPSDERTTSAHPHHQRRRHPRAGPRRVRGDRARALRRRVDRRAGDRPVRRVAFALAQRSAAPARGRAEAFRREGHADRLRDHGHPPHHGGQPPDPRALRRQPRAERRRGL